jgi:beta-aspartyl-peptidase (threonine type)
VFDMSRWALVIHGGAGLIQRRWLRPEQEHAYRAALSNAIRTGSALLSAGGGAIDCVEAVICVLEDDPLFNAGRGSVFTATGHIELDASIMDGRTLAAGAVAGITRARHPISLARRLMQESVHVMLSGQGADAFSESSGLEQVAPSWFHTQTRWHALATWLAQNSLPIPESPATAQPAHDADALIHDESKFGTVGAVALDRFGTVAAGTSSGGTNGKRPGRVGDSPIIGAGTYASNASCAVSATGSGEHLIRIAAAHEVCALVEHKQLRLQSAVDEVIQRRLAALGATGGVVAVAPDGQIAWGFNTAGMYRACVGSDHALQVALYGDYP